MSVSWRYILTGAAALAGLAATGFGLQSAGAQSCCGHTGDQTVNVPGVTVGSPSVVYGSGDPGCCGHAYNHAIGTPGVTVGAPNVQVTGPNVTSSQTVIGVGTQSTLPQTFISNGAYIPGPPPVPSTIIDGLEVEGAVETYREMVTEKVPVETQRQVCHDQHAGMMLRPVRAVCIDDKGTPHPASQVEDGQRVNAAYQGEVFRCMAGTAMQVTVGSLNGSQADFGHAESFSCAKGESLVHGQGGKLSCAPQAPRRNCNERSLLRKFGPGLKLVQMSGTQRVCAPQTEIHYEMQTREVVKERPVVNGPIVFDGGVGQGVY